MDTLKTIALTFWVGGLWVVGVLVAPLLFGTLDGNTALAGQLTGVILRGMGWAGLVCGPVLLLHLFMNQGWRAVQGASLWLVLGMLACTAVNQFAVFPIIAEVRSTASEVMRGLFGGGFRAWHTISSLIYLLECVLGLAVLLKDGGGR